MRTMNQSLADLYFRQAVSFDEILERSNDQEDLKREFWRVIGGLALIVVLAYDITAWRWYGLVDDHAFNHFRAGADETVVFDNGGCRLQRFEYAADADAAREMHVLANLRT